MPSDQRSPSPLSKEIIEKKEDVIFFFFIILSTPGGGGGRKTALAGIHVNQKKPGLKENTKISHSLLLIYFKIKGVRVFCAQLGTLW